MLTYYAFTLDSIFKLVPPKISDLGSELTWQTNMLYSYIVLLIYVNETICMVICLSSRFLRHFPSLATHSSILTWRIPETEEPGGLPSMGLHRVWHDWSDLAAAAMNLLLNSKKRWDMQIFNSYWLAVQSWVIFFEHLKTLHGPLLAIWVL